MNRESPRSTTLRSAARAALAGAGALVGAVLLLPLLVLSLPFWAVRAVTAAGRAAARAMEPEVTSWGELIRYEPDVGWRPRPDMDVHARAGHVFRLTTDREGWRGRTTLEEADLVLFGDSFAFGYGADDETFFTERGRDLSMKAVGANGYSMVQGLLWMERLAPRLRGKPVAWMVYYGNDLLENLRPNLDAYRMPFLREDGTGSWEVVTEHVSPDPWPFPTSRNYTRRLAEICCPGHLSDRVFGACGYLVERAREVCESAGSRLLVVGIPDVDQVVPERRRHLASLAPDPGTFRPDRPDRELAAICRRLDVPFLPLAEHLGPEDHLPDDCHWSDRGHGKVARLLEAEVDRMTDLPVGHEGAARREDAAPEADRTPAPARAGGMR